MTVLNIVKYPDPVLRKKAKPVSEFNTSTVSLIDHLVDTLHSTTGIGLCAPQLGYSIQVMAMDLSEEKNNTEVFVNPSIISKSGFAIVKEQCLSIPNVSANVMRSSAVTVRALDRHGKEMERTYEGMHAICLQHEIDHLAGMLFIDRISRLRRLRFKKVLGELERSNIPALSLVEDIVDCGHIDTSR